MISPFATYTAENRWLRDQCGYYKELVLEAQSDGPDAYTEQAYDAFVDALLRDGTTLAKAFGQGGWCAVDNAEPYTGLAELSDAARRARSTFYAPVRISDVNHNGSMLGRPAVNLAFRAHHDACHVIAQCGFDLLGEAEVAREQIERLGGRTLDETTTIIVGEVIGQGIYHGIYKSFPLVNGQQPFVPFNRDVREWCAEVLYTLTGRWE
jgi:hypothetical protein